MDYFQPIAVIPCALFRDNQLSSEHTSSQHTSSHRWSVCWLWRSHGEALKTEDRKVHLKYIQGLVMIYPRLSIATYLKIADSSASNPFAFALFGYYRAKKTCQNLLGWIAVKAILRTRNMVYSQALRLCIGRACSISNSSFQPFLSLTTVSRLWLTSSAMRSISQMLRLIGKVLFA